MYENLTYFSLLHLYGSIHPLLGVCKLAFVDEEAENNRLHHGTGDKGTPVIWKTLDEVLKKYKK